ncbi:MAG TPA: hypothetical protein VIM14_01165 [Polyangia bacterium]
MRAPLLFATLLALPSCVSPAGLFKRNAELKAQGYYMAEFEFKMEAALFHLNNGDYWKAYSTLRRVKHEMETQEGLVKVPVGASDQERIEFLLSRQRPDTGAFMDADYPFFTFIGPTGNVLDELHRLSGKTGQPIHLRHPLRFLDAIDTPDKLRAYFGTLLYIQEKWADRFGGPAPYVVGVSEYTGVAIERMESMGGYRFTQEWKDALSEFFRDTQDPETGFWGARIGDKDHWRQAVGIDSTAHILKHFLTERGEPRDSRYPLRYADEMVRHLLSDLALPVPEGKTEQHEWNLRQAHAVKILVRFLWPGLSQAERQQILLHMPKWLEKRFAMYRPAQGGFAVDSRSNVPDIDATCTALTFLSDSGYIPGTWRRERLRGQVLADGSPLVSFPVGRWQEGRVPSNPAVNSFRVYRNQLPAEDVLDDTDLVRIVYPHKTPIPDVMELRQGLARYADAAGGEFGNWTSKASLKDEPLGLDKPVRAMPVQVGAVDLAAVVAGDPSAHRLFVVGYDQFQVPIFRSEFHLTESHQ